MNFLSHFQSPKILAINLTELDPYERVFNEEETLLVLDTTVIQYLAIIAGY